MSIKTKATLLSDLTSILTNGGLLTATEDRGMRTDFIDSLACLLGTNSFVGNQDITGTLGVSGRITNTVLTASEILGTNASKELVSLAVATYPSLTELAFVKGVSSAIQTQINALNADWTDVPYDAGNFTAGGGTWTVAEADQAFYRYRVLGDLFFIQMHLASTSISGTPQELIVAMPAGITLDALEQAQTGSLIVDGSAIEMVYVGNVSGDLWITRVPTADFIDGTNNMNILFSGIFKIA